MNSQDVVLVLGALGVFFGLMGGAAGHTAAESVNPTPGNPVYAGEHPVA